MLVPQLIPQRVKLMIMFAPLVVRKLMQHSINDLLERQKQIRIVVIAQTHADFVAAVDVQSEQVSLWWQELGQDLDAPAAFPHDGLDGRGHFAQERESRIAAREAGEVLVGVEEWLVFFELGGGVALHAAGSAVFGGSVAAGVGGSAVWSHPVLVVL
jgi:hypothetical protein